MLGAAEGARDRPPSDGVVGVTSGPRWMTCERLATQASTDDYIIHVSRAACIHDQAQARSDQLYIEKMVAGGYDPARALLARSSVSRAHVYNAHKNGGSGCHLHSPQCLFFWKRRDSRRRRRQYRYRSRTSIAIGNRTASDGMYRYRNLSDSVGQYRYRTASDSIAIGQRRTVSHIGHDRTRPEGRVDVTTLSRLGDRTRLDTTGHNDQEVTTGHEIGQDWTFAHT